MARPRLLLAPLLVLAVLGLAATACGKIAKPSGWASPTLANGVVLVAYKDKLYALDPTTLDAHWRFPPAGGKNNPSPGALYGSPAASESTVFVPGYSGNLYAVSTKDGTPGNQPFVTDGPLVGGVTISGTTAYFGSSDSKVYALNTTSPGQELWHFTTGNEVWSTPVIDGDALYVTSLDGKLYVLDAASGTLRWSFTTDAGIGSPAVVDKTAGLVYLAGLDAKLRAVDLQTHTQRWAIKADNWFWTSPLVDSGTVYAGSMDHKVYAVDIATGTARWARPFATQDAVRAAPVMAGGKLIVVDRGGHVFALSPQNGTMAPPKPLALGANVLADPLVLPDGKVLFVTTSGEAIRVDPATLTITNRKKVA